MRPFSYMNDFTLNGEQPVMVPIKLQSLRDIVQYLFTGMNEWEFESDYEYKKVQSLLDEFNFALEKTEFEARQEKTKLAQIDPRLKIIANHFGFQAQAEKAIEEMAELMVEIRHLKKRSEHAADDYTRFIEELVDVKIMIDQLVYLVRQDEECADSFDLQTEYKIERTLRRIAEEELQA